jgi:hypothetical protein
MKSLMGKGGIAVTVSQLDGYLQALRDMNDDHSGGRYWFWANMINIKNRNVTDVIKSHLKEKVVIINEIDLREELKIIQNHITENYLQGTSNPNSQEEKYIKNLHGWRIQDYILMASNYDYDNIHGRWVVETTAQNGIRTTIFTQVKRNLIVMSFLKRPISAEC